MKRVFAVAAALVLLFSAQAAYGADNVSVTVDGQVIGAYEVKWNEAGDRTFIGADFFQTHLGALVETDGDVTTVSKNGHSISFKAGDNFFIMNGIGSRMLGTANFTADGISYLPLRFMCEALGAVVDWDTATRSAKITNSAITLTDEAKAYLKNVEVYDQAAVRIAGEKIIYIDPYRIIGTPHDADIILVTHTHQDHLDINSIKNVMKESTVLYITADGVSRAEENGLTKVKSVLPNEEYLEDGVIIKTVPAYNTSPTRQNHPKENNWAGYIITMDSITYYHAGDTDYIPEMDNIDADVAFFPIDGRFNMDRVEAAAAANAVAPKVAVAFHYNNFMSDNDALEFIPLLDEGIIGAIMNFKMY